MINAPVKKSKLIQVEGMTKKKEYRTKKMTYQLSNKKYNFEYFVHNQSQVQKKEGYRKLIVSVKFSHYIMNIRKFV